VLRPSLVQAGVRLRWYGLPTREVGAIRSVFRGQWLMQFRHQIHFVISTGYKQIFEAVQILTQLVFIVRQFLVLLSQSG